MRCSVLPGLSSRALLARATSHSTAFSGAKVQKSLEIVQLLCSISKQVFLTRVLFHNLANSFGSVVVECDDDVHSLEWSVALEASHIDVSHLGYLLGQVDVVDSSH